MTTETKNDQLKKLEKYMVEAWNELQNEVNRNTKNYEKIAFLSRLYNLSCQMYINHKE